jgi:hypothetical protein
LQKAEAAAFLAAVLVEMITARSNPPLGNRRRYVRIGVQLKCFVEAQRLDRRLLSASTRRGVRPSGPSDQNPTVMNIE